MKFWQVESNNILKRSYIMSKWALFQGCKDSSVFANQSVLYTMFTNWKMKTIWLLNRCRESLWQNSRPIYDKNSPESRHIRNIPQHNKSHIWQTHKKHPQWRKIESISYKIRNKTSVPTLTTTIQYSFHSLKLCFPVHMPNNIHWLFWVFLVCIYLAAPKS